eukprot:UN25289
MPYVENSLGKYGNEKNDSSCRERIQHYLMVNDTHYQKVFLGLITSEHYIILQWIYDFFFTIIYALYSLITMIGSFWRELLIILLFSFVGYLIQHNNTKEQIRPQKNVQIINLNKSSESISSTIYHSRSDRSTTVLKKTQKIKTEPNIAGTNTEFKWKINHWRDSLKRRSIIEKEIDMTHNDKKSTTNKKRSTSHEPKDADKRFPTIDRTTVSPAQINNRLPGKINKRSTYMMNERDKKHSFQDQENMREPLRAPRFRKQESEDCKSDYMDHQIMDKTEKRFVNNKTKKPSLEYVRLCSVKHASLFRTGTDSEWKDDELSTLEDEMKQQMEHLKIVPCVGKKTRK